MKEINNLDEYQKTAMSVLYPFKDKGEQLEYAVLALCGEAGELANVLKKIFYYKDTSLDGKNLLDELSDVLWYVACIADALDVTLSKVATHSANKVLMKKTTKARADTENRMKEHPEKFIMPVKKEAKKLYLKEPELKVVSDIVYEEYTLKGKPITIKRVYVKGAALEIRDLKSWFKKGLKAKKILKYKHDEFSFRWVVWYI